ncbi:MAG: POTRA domain-containing protein [Verrucomicrobiales bacterium]|nr:POTRA domain-containing protein [Verrucomicrobiales bacterium]
MMRSMKIVVVLWVLSAGMVPAQDAVVIDGLATVDEREAREMITNQVQAVEKLGASGARADDAAFFLQLGLRKLGYKGAQVRWDLGAGGKVLLTVEEGAPAELGEVKLSGNTALEDAAIVELLTKATRERLFLPVGATVPYVAAEIESGVGAIVGFYGLLGYVEAAVEVTGTVDRDGVVDVELAIDEGIVHRVGTITLPVLPDGVEVVGFDGLKGELEGKPFTSSIPAVLEGRVEQAVSGAGFVEVSVVVTPGEHRMEGDVDVVDLTVAAEWGERYQLTGLEVEGNEEIKTQFFERMFRDEIGQTYSPEAVGAVVNDILETGAFESVILNPVPSEEKGGVMTLGLEVKEAKTQNVGVAVGLGTYEGGILALDYRDVGVMGMARTFSGGLE